MGKGAQQRHQERRKERYFKRMCNHAHLHEVPVIMNRAARSRTIKLLPRVYVPNGITSEPYKPSVRKTLILRDVNDNHTSRISSKRQVQKAIEHNRECLIKDYAEAGKGLNLLKKD